MRVYLDNCCYNRPFDDQDQLTIRLETVTKLAVQLMMALGAMKVMNPIQFITEECNEDDASIGQ